MKARRDDQPSRDRMNTLSVQLASQINGITGIEYEVIRRDVQVANDLSVIDDTILERRSIEGELRTKLSSSRSTDIAFRL